MENGPFYLQGDKVIVCDCDDTLVLWGTDTDIKYDDTVYQKENVVEFEYTDSFNQTRTFYLIPNKRVIKHLEHMKQTGAKVVVWSAGGSHWANYVVQKLEISHLVDVIMSKPTWYLDDLHCTEWMGSWRQVRREDGKIIKFGPVYRNPHRKNKYESEE